MSVSVTEAIDVSAPSDIVWRVLTDFAGYGSWSDASIDGVARVGSRLTVGMPGMSFHPVVTAVEPGRRLQWNGTLFWKGLLQGKHSFLLTTNDDDTTRLVNHETFTAPFPHWFAPSSHSTGASMRVVTATRISTAA